jgi:hypothetical protein
METTTLFVSPDERLSSQRRRFPCFLSAMRTILRLELSRKERMGGDDLLLARSSS